jgi:PAS domain S-box-containing protein
VFIAPIRLSAAVASVALMMSPVSTWALYLLALVPVHLLFRNPVNGFSVALEYFAANAAAALAGAVVMRWLLGTRPTLDALRHCLVFLGACALAAPVVAATVGTPSVTRRALTVSVWSTWETWALAEAAGMLVVVPVLLALPGWLVRGRGRIDGRRAVEAMVLGAGILLATAPTLGWAGLVRQSPGSMLAVQQFLIVTSATSVTLAGLMAERWRTLGALRESESRYRELVESANDMILLTAPSGEVWEVNRACEAGTGWSRDAWAGRPVFDLLAPTERPAAHRQFLEAVRHGPVDTLLWRMVARDGTERTLDVRITSYGTEGRVARVMILARDVSEQLRAAEERALVEAQLQQSRKMHAVGQLAGGIAHDFNNLLQALSGYTDPAVDALPANHAALAPLHNVAKVADRAATLTRQLLAFSRRDELQPARIDLGAVVTEFVRILRRMIGEQIQITVSAAEGARRSTPIGTRSSRS